MIWLEIPGILLLFLGVFCANVGAVGLIRFPDVFTRSHAATVINMGGAVLTCFSIAILGISIDLSITVRVFLIALIIILTSPTGTHAILRAAYKSGIPLWPKTLCDKLGEKESG